MDLDGLNPYGSRRQPLFAPRGVVATSQPLAAEAGMEMLRRGGSAADAAIAAAAALTVVEPTSNGIGGDAFALVWDGAALRGLNGSGRAPAALTADAVRARGHDRMPESGWLPVTVPGAPAAWRDLHARFGRLPFADLFAPAIHYADHGYPVPQITAAGWRAGARRHLAAEGPEFAGWAPTFAPGGRAPAAGETWASAGHARTLRRIAETRAEAFYRGEIADAVAAFAAATGGLLTADDLARHDSTWVAPIHAAYRGHEVWEIPPNGQGIAALIALNLLDGFDVAASPRESAESYHLQIEAMKLAFADARRYVADPERADVPTAGLLAPEYAAARRPLLTETAGLHAAGEPARGGTVYLAAADAGGMMVSFIQSNFMGFGSGVVVPGTGVALQNRGAGFTLDPDHPNRLEPGKRPFHTIIPGFLTRGGAPVGPFGVMGGHMQPQGHVQVVVSTLDYGLNPQAALDAPRWQWEAGRSVLVEAGVAPEIVAALRGRGHEITVSERTSLFGRGQAIWRLPSGAGYVAGTESRADGAALGC